MSRENRNYSCPSCGMLATVPWSAAWCMHHERPLAHPPSWLDSDWTRMVPVTEVKLGVLPPEAEEWYVVEQRNQFGYPGDVLPEGVPNQRIVAGPMEREAAYAAADAHPRDKGIPEYAHSVRAVPGDLLAGWR